MKWAVCPAFLKLALQMDVMHQAFVAPLVSQDSDQQGTGLHFPFPGHHLSPPASTLRLQRPIALQYLERPLHRSAG